MRLATMFHGYFACSPAASHSHVFANASRDTSLRVMTTTSTVVGRSRGRVFHFWNCRRRRRPATARRRGSPRRPGRTGDRLFPRRSRRRHIYRRGWLCPACVEQVWDAGARGIPGGPPDHPTLGEQADEFLLLRDDTDDRQHRLRCSQAAIERRASAAITCSAASRGESSRLYWVSVSCCGQVMASSAKTRAATT